VSFLILTLKLVRINICHFLQSRVQECAAKVCVEERLKPWKCTFEFLFFELIFLYSVFFWTRARFSLFVIVARKSLNSWKSVIAGDFPCSKIFSPITILPDISYQNLNLRLSELKIYLDISLYFQKLIFE
jgi:hypothetical protein